MFHSWLIDRKIRAVNVSLDLPLQEYARLSRSILQKNELQRKRVSSSGKVYQLLKRDLMEGCVMPPIILAVSENRRLEIHGEIDRLLAGALQLPSESLVAFVNSAIASQDLIILDGLQRTYTVQDVVSGLDIHGTHDTQLVRLEIYIGLSKTGILYRMLTLNTGQTPMTFRHQIEMLYHDYIDNDSLPDGISIIREADEKKTRGIGKYRYSDVVDMFHAFAMGTPQPLDREALVTKLRELEFIEAYRPEGDGMLDLLQLYNLLVARIDEQAPGWQASAEDTALLGLGQPFGSSVASIFSKSQPMTGFGAEYCRLDKKSQMTVPRLREAIGECRFGINGADALSQLLHILDEIAQTAKKIGDAQRNYFQLAFRQLLNTDSDAFLNLSECWLAGHLAFKSMY